MDEERVVGERADEDRAEVESGSLPVGIPRLRILVVVVVVLGFAVLLFGKTWLRSRPEAGAPAPSVARTAAEATSAASPSSERIDAVARYEDARRDGKPVYVLFHSLTCRSCIEISEVVDDVVPDYEGKVVFVNALTDDPRTNRLARSFSFQYIPTSFFVAADGTVASSFTGPMSEADMRARLDGLVAR